MCLFSENKMYLLNENMLIERKVVYRPKMKNEKAQFFDDFKCICNINLCNHVT